MYLYAPKTRYEAFFYEKPGNYTPIVPQNAKLYTIGMSKNRNLAAARLAKNDEFYTRLEDIEEQLKYYDFKDKIVFCNCDDPFESNFFKYFALNFNHLGLRELIATSYMGSPVLGTELKEVKTPYKARVKKVQDMTGDGAVTLEDIKRIFELPENELTELEGDGDFRSDECIELLKEADVVVTNPPFSIWVEYVETLLEYDKKFIIIGPKNAVTLKKFFPLIKDEKVWLGYPFPHGNAYFYVKDGSGYAPGVYDPETGLVKFRNCDWYTNMDIPKRHEKMILVKNYSEEEYPKYDDYGIINVNKIADIPDNYFDIMGVPITYLNVHNPEQFEILGIANSARWIGHECYTLINGKKIYNRILIRRVHEGRA